MSEIINMLSYHFMQRALIVGVLVSLCAALLGVSLVLKRYSMIGDGLSHVGFGALAIASALGLAPLAVAVPVVVLAAVLLLRLSQNSKIKGDAAIAMISSSALAIGVVVISVTTGMNTEVSSYMFGSVLSLSRGDAVLSVILSIAVLLAFTLLYPRIFAVLTAVTVVLGMRMMGALLISSLIIFPALSAMRVCKSFRAVVLCSAAISVVCFILGVLASYFWETPTGASIVIADLICFGLFSLLGKK